MEAYKDSSVEYRSRPTDLRRGGSSEREKARDPVSGRRQGDGTFFDGKKSLRRKKNEGVNEYETKEREPGVRTSPPQTLKRRQR